MTPERLAEIKADPRIYRQCACPSHALMRELAAGVQEAHQALEEAEAVIRELSLS